MAPPNSGNADHAKAETTGSPADAVAQAETLVRRVLGHFGMDPDELFVCEEVGWRIPAEGTEVQLRVFRASSAWSTKAKTTTTSRSPHP